MTTVRMSLAALICALLAGPLLASPATAVATCVPSAREKYVAVSDIDADRNSQMDRLVSIVCRDGGKVVKIRQVAYPPRNTGRFNCRGWRSVRLNPTSIAHFDPASYTFTCSSTAKLLGRTIYVNRRINDDGCYEVGTRWDMVRIGDLTGWFYSWPKVCV